MEKSQINNKRRKALFWLKSFCGFHSTLAGPTDLGLMRLMSMYAYWDNEAPSKYFLNIKTKNDNNCFSGKLVKINPTYIRVQQNYTIWFQNFFCIINYFSILLKDSFISLLCNVLFSVNLHKCIITLLFRNVFKLCFKKN